MLAVQSIWRAALFADHLLFPMRRFFSVKCGKITLIYVIYGRDGTEYE
ncbi:hypothetical protein HMPREF0908_0326 [Selenomonas flueggei ATCC 43531]|uniref:Uncharacterized protein n=1 Tax=Selenomonas flueggei ATCC 43531 TaxID=638302 RepID=C4V1D2_9FIRM|nr:hypothetical protein HMPREF0908_0326 [Selenomonas flueggei ATCC 43531]